MSSVIPPSIGMQGGGQHTGPPPPGGGGGPAKQVVEITKIKNPKSFVVDFILL